MSSARRPGPSWNLFGDTLNGLPRYVASTTLDEPLEWKHATLLDGHVPTAVADLKRAVAKNIVVVGSGRLVRTLLTTTWSTRSRS